MTAPYESINIYDDRDILFAEITDMLENEILKAGAGANVALAGGETPKSVYRLLAERALPWEEVNFYPTDERCVDADSPRRNDAMLRDCLGGKAQVVSVEEGDTPPSLYIALLGMGEDGHIASLFPGSPIGDKTIFRTSPADVPEERLSMPLSTFVNTQKTVLLFCGENKWNAFANAPELKTPVAALLEKKKIDVYYAP